MFQLIIGVVRPAPYPNTFLRRVWMWAHRVVGDGVLVLAWINLWEALGAWYGGFNMNIIVPFVLMFATAFLTPSYFMFKSARAEAKANLESPEEDSAARDVIVRMPTENLVNTDNYFGCGHCDRVFTDRRTLEVHTRFIHPDLSYKEVLTPMTRRFADVMKTPAIMEGYPLSEVAKHKHQHDLWCVINGKVYDLTNFASLHPGGPKPILSWAGRDASKAWNLIHQPAWLSRYEGQFEVLGPLAPEPPVEGMTPQGMQVGALRARFKDSTMTNSQVNGSEVLLDAQGP